MNPLMGILALLIYLLVLVILPATAIGLILYSLARLVMHLTGRPHVGRYEEATEPDVEPVVSPGPRLIPVVVGVTLNLAWVAVLFGICATDDGHLRTDWLKCVFWCSIIALPAALAITSLRTEQRSFLVAAAILCAPLALISLAGATLPLLIPGILYSLGALTSRPAPNRGLRLALIVFVIAATTVVGYFSMLFIGGGTCVKSMEVSRHSRAISHQVERPINGGPC